MSKICDVFRHYTIYVCRVGTSLPYFIGELLYVSSEELEHIRTIPLYVITVYSNQKSSINTENSKSALFSNYQYNHSQHDYQ